MASAKSVTRPAQDAGHVSFQAADGGEVLDQSIARAQSAYDLVIAADSCLKNGDDGQLLALGFSQEHIADLRQRAMPLKGYPTYAIQNIRRTLEFLKRERAGER